MGAIRRRLLMLGGFNQEKPIRLFEYEPEVKLSVLEEVVFRAMYFVRTLSEQQRRYDECEEDYYEGC